MASEYYFKDYENYLLLFKQHSVMVAEMMSILNDQIFDRGLSPVESNKLFRMTVDLLYDVNRTYKEENKLPDQYEIVTFPKSDEVLNSMRSLLKEELDRYLGSRDATNQ